MPRSPRARRPSARVSVRSRAVCVLGLLGALAPACASRERAEAAVRALVDREVAAINARDLKALGDIWAQDDAILMFEVVSPGRFEGWERIGRQWRDFFGKVTDLSLKVEAVRVEAGGSLAYATYDWSLEGRMGDYALQDRGQATAVYRKGKDGWRLVHAHYSAVPAGAESGPPGPGAADSEGPEGAGAADPEGPKGGERGGPEGAGAPAGRPAATPPGGKDPGPKAPR
jgi:ketosteroid isomerase-like protein